MISILSTVFGIFESAFTNALSMKNLFIALFTVTVQFLTLNSFAQEKSTVFSPHFFFEKNKNFDERISPGSYSLSNDYNSSGSGNNVLSIESSVHYSAFFCRMENTLRKQFGIWVRVRAGEGEPVNK